MNQKGSLLPLILIGLALIGIAVLTGSKLTQNANNSTTGLISLRLQTKQSYQDSQLNFKFDYPAGYEVVSDSEKDYFQRTKADQRKNFSGYVGYEPPQLVKALVLKKSGTQLGSEFDSVPLNLWIFDNPNKLSIDGWFDKYWYYPFVWGIFAQPGKGHIEPTQEATISGQLAKFRQVDYQPNKPTYYYLIKDDKTYLFKVIDQPDLKVDQILSSFKF